VAFLCALAAQAGTITSITPSSLNVASGEYFIRVTGSGLGDQVVFTGPAGTFVLNINARDASSVTSWIPLEVVNRAGSYSVVSRGPNGDSNAATLSVNGSFFNKYVLLVPEVMIISARSGKGEVVKYTDLSAVGGEDPKAPSTISCEPASGSVFKLGATLVRCSAANTIGERADNQFTVNVADLTAPVINVPKDIVVDEGTPVSWETSAFDDIDGDLRVTCNGQSGSVFPVGTTKVTCSATDFSLNPAVGSFDVVVRGKGRLTIRIPDTLVYEADRSDGAFVNYVVSAYGTSDTAPVVKCDPRPGDFFKLGTTAVYCSAEDRFGNTAETKFELTVVDSVGPIISTSVDPQWLVPVDGRMATVVVTTEANDVVDPAPTCSITSIAANEQISIDDTKIVSDREVALRASTNGKGTDRIYQINIQCTDASRNISTAVANAMVPASGEAPKPANLGTTKPSGSKRRAGGGK
jgi:hypothetical protein